MKKGLFLRKSIHARFEEGDGEGSSVKRRLGALNLTAIGIGAIIGAGIFVITGQAAANYAGPAIVLSFIAAALICFLAGLCYAELSSMIPIAGGSYSFSYVAMGEFVAWLVGWTLIAQCIISASTVCVGWSGYFVSFLNDIGIHISPTWSEAAIMHTAEKGWGLTDSVLNLPAMGLVLFLTIMISIGVRAVSYFNNAMVVIKISTVLLFIALGINYVNTDNWVPFIPENTGHFGQFGWSGVLRGAGLVFFAYIGFDTISTLACDAKNPQKDLPIGILGSLALCTVAYIITAFILTGVVHYSNLGVPDPMSVALNVMGPHFKWLKIVVKLAIIAGLTSVSLVQFLGQTRVFMAMSRDGLLPQKFHKLHPKLESPLFSCILTGLVAMFLVGLFPVNILGELVSMATLFLFTIVCLGVLILRKTHPEFQRKFKVPFVPWVPLLGACACVAQMCFFPLFVWIEFMAWLLIGLVIYFSYSMKHSYIRK